ncbi:MAG: hypothetical protein ABR511_08135 [Acidimicrobiales bacterium]
MSTARHPRPLAVGLALLVVYAGAVLATALAGGHSVRPLFDGIGPPPAYQWVSPPAAFKKGNLVPTPGTGQIAFTGGSSAAGAFQTPDGQFVVDFTGGAVPPHGADSAVAGTLTPLDPATLGPVPSPLRPTGNAYRIELSYSPSRQPVTTLTKPGDLFLTVPEAAEVILYSADGKAWQRIDTKQVAAGVTVGAQFQRAGWYVGATSAAPATTAAPAGSSGGSRVAVVAVIVVAVVVIGVLGPWAWWRRARRRARPGRRGGGGGDAGR